MGPMSFLFFVNVLKISIFFVFIASNENADALFLPASLFLWSRISPKSPCLQLFLRGSLKLTSIVSNNCQVQEGNNLLTLYSYLGVSAHLLCFYFIYMLAKEQTNLKRKMKFLNFEDNPNYCITTLHTSVTYTSPKKPEWEVLGWMDFKGERLGKGRGESSTVDCEALGSQGVGCASLHWESTVSLSHIFHLSSPISCAMSFSNTFVIHWFLLDISHSAAKWRDLTDTTQGVFSLPESTVIFHFVINSWDISSF